MRAHLAAMAVVFGQAALALPVGAAAGNSAADPFAMLQSIPAPPADVPAAGKATRVGGDSNRTVFSAPAYEALTAHIKESLLKPAAIAGAAGAAAVAGIDLARANSDPAYAAQLQARMQTMSLADKMALANQIRAQQQAAAGPPGSGAEGALFIAQEHSADMATKEKMRAVFDSALAAVGAKHKAIDDTLNAQARACPTGPTGWPLESCTDPLGVKSIAQHRALEGASLREEAQALDHARAIALAEMNKARDLLAHATGSSATSLTAWAMNYVLILNDYAKEITLRAGFWAHANASKYTGSLSVYIQTPGGPINWPLADPSYGQSIGAGL